MLSENLSKGFYAIRDLHVNQNFYSKIRTPSVDDLLRRYFSLPDEALYLVECRTAQVEPLTKNFREMIGIDYRELSEIYQLFEHVDLTMEMAFIKYTLNLVTVTFKNIVSLETENDICRSLYKTRDGRIMLKTTTTLVQDHCGSWCYTIGKFQDLSKMIDLENFKFQFTGPNSKHLRAHFLELSGFDQILSGRELKILYMIGHGYTSHQIAKKLFISKHTVDTHRRNIIRKLEVDGSLKAYLKAKDLGLFKF